MLRSDRRTDPASNGPGGGGRGRGQLGGMRVSEGVAFGFELKDVEISSFSAIESDPSNDG